MRFAFLASLFFLFPIIFSIPCSSIGVNGSVYSSITLTQDLESTEDCLSIGANNVTLDCAGHTLTGSRVGTGIRIFGRNGVDVRNCRVSNFNYGIYASLSDSSTIQWNTVTECYIGIFTSSSSSISIDKNSVEKNGQGIYAYDLTDSSITGSRARESKGPGLELKSSFSDKIQGNDLSSNRVGLAISTSSEIEVLDNDLRGCYLGYQESGTRGVVFSGNAMDVLSGSAWDSLVSDIRSAVGLVIVLLLLSALIFIIGKGKPREAADDKVKIDKFEAGDLERERQMEENQ
ncbi:MAG: NosD domain-containing protein [Candidatus Micrarchaeota archaeon]